MVINPLIPIIGLFLMIYCIINKPDKPILTGTSIFMLTCSIIFTYLINMAINQTITQDSQFINFLVTMLILPNPDVQTTLEIAFDVYVVFDILWILACIASMVVEIKHIFTISKTSKEKRYGEKSV